MTDSANKDLRLVCLAALAWLHEHDYPGEHAGGMDDEIDPAELASAIDRLTETPQRLPASIEPDLDLPTTDKRGSRD